MTLTLTLTQLAQKHNLEPEGAKAFLREWLDMQELQGYLSVIPNKNGTYRQEYTLLPAHVGVAWQIPLIARPTDLGE